MTINGGAPATLTSRWSGDTSVDQFLDEYPLARRLFPPPKPLLRRSERAIGVLRRSVLLAMVGESSGDYVSAALISFPMMVYPLVLAWMLPIEQ